MIKKVRRNSAKLFPWFLVILLVAAIPQKGYSQAVSSRHIKLIRPNDAGFDELMNTNFPGMETVDNFQSIRPFVALLQNDGDVWVRAYCIEWDTTFSSGQQRSDRLFFIQNDYGTAFDVKPFVPGEVRLVTPGFDVSASQYRRWEDGF